MTRWNLVPNPRAHVNATDGWVNTGDLSRETTPPVALPAGFDACWKLINSTYASPYILGNGAVAPFSSFQLFTFWALALNAVTDCQFVVWYPGGSTPQYFTLSQSNEWVQYNLALATDPTYTQWRISFLTPAGIAVGSETYITGLQVEPSPTNTPYDYADGDTSGWAWDGTAHNSISREADPYGANVLINGGASVVFDPAVTLTLNPGTVAATEMAVRNDEDAYGAWEAFAATKAWTLSAACKVWAKFRDSA